MQAKEGRRAEGFFLTCIPTQKSLLKSSLQILRSEQPLLKATIREQSEKIAKLEDKIVQLEGELGNAMKKLANVGGNEISKEGTCFKEDGKFQFVVNSDGHNILEHHICTFSTKFG